MIPTMAAITSPTFHRTRPSTGATACPSGPLPPRTTPISESALIAAITLLAKMLERAVNSQLASQLLNSGIALQHPFIVPVDAVRVCDELVYVFLTCTYRNVMSAVNLPLTYLIDPQFSKNEATFRSGEWTAELVILVWPNPPAPVTLATNHCALEVAEAMIKALAGACPERALAGWARRFRIAISGKNPRSGRPFIWHLFHARGGGGGSSAGDGWGTAGEGQAAGGIKFGSVEVAEARFPLFFKNHEFRPDSAGDGRFRGGVGSALELRMETTEPARGNTAGDGVRHPSYGLLGGKDGLPHRYVMVAGGKRRVLKTKEARVPIPPGAGLHIGS